MYLEILMGEVYGNFSDCFTTPFTPMSATDSSPFRGTVVIGNKILVLSNFFTKHSCFDVDKEEWSYIESIEFNHDIGC